MPMNEQETRFLDALFADDTDHALELLSTRKINLNLRYDGTPVLQLAIMRHNVRVVEKLLELRADANAKGTEGTTALHAASQTCVPELVRLLISRARVNEKDNSGCTPLHYVCGVNPPPEERAIVPHNDPRIYESERVPDKLPIEETPMLTKIKRRANIEEERPVARQVTYTPEPPLPGPVIPSQASPSLRAVPIAPLSRGEVISGSLSIVRMLVGAGANVNMRTTEGKAPLDIAFEGYREDIMCVLIEAGAELQRGREFLQTACNCDMLHLARALVARGVKADFCDENGWTPLHHAAYGGKVELVKLLIDAGGKVDAKDNEGNTPMNYAVSTDHSSERALQSGACLVASGAKTNCKDSFGRTPIHIAAKSGHMPLTKALVEAKADLNAKDKYGEIPLNEAIGNMHEDVAREIILGGANVNAHGAYGYSPLHLAIDKGMPRIFELLLSQKANVNLKDAEGRTPLMHAASANTKWAAEGLVAKKADANAKDKYGETALTIAVRNATDQYNSKRGDAVEVAKLILASGANPNIFPDKKPLLHLVRGKDNRELQKALLDAGADPNAKDEYGSAALFYAIYDRDAEFARMLVEKKADVNALDQHGERLLWRAINMDQAEICKLLIEGGAQLDYLDLGGRTVLYYPVKYGKKEIVELLLKAKVDPNAFDKDGETALRIAIYDDRLEIGKMLIDAGANPSLVDAHGNTPFYHAFYHMNMQFVKMFLDLGADPDMKFNDGKTPLIWLIDNTWFDKDKKLELARMLVYAGAKISSKSARKGMCALTYAFEMRKFELIPFLVESGADLSVVDDEGRTPLHAAVGAGDLSLVKLLVEKGADLSAKDMQGRTPEALARDCYYDGVDEIREYLENARTI